MQIHPSHPAPVATVISLQGESPARAREVAQQLGLQYGTYQDPVGLLLVVGEASAWLQLDGVRGAVQFDSAAMQHRRKGGHNEMLGRAVGLKADRKPLVWDATGGLGRDAFVLADLGCEVTLCERMPVLAWLLDQAVQAAAVSGVARHAAVSPAGPAHPRAPESQEPSPASIWSRRRPANAGSCSLHRRERRRNQDRGVRARLPRSHEAWRGYPGR